MKFKEALEHIDGLRTVAAELDVLSAPGRSMLMESEFLTSPRALQREFDSVATAKKFVVEPSNSFLLADMRRLLMQTRDISTTLGRLASGATLDEVELFEIKGLCLLAEPLSRLISSSPLGTLPALSFPTTFRVLALLDPEQTGSAHFHIYDAYSPRLAEKRAELRRLQATPGYDEEASSMLTAECMAIEDTVKEQLSIDLRPYHETLAGALKCIAATDLLLAKASMAIAHNLCRPEISECETSFNGLRYLPVEISLKDDGKEFQPVDITLPTGVTLITGANMGGKTITLKSVALAQAMAQFGLFVAAEKVTILPVDDILQSVGDAQSASQGLSSFGAEILKLNDIILTIKKGGMHLVVIDEPARTTNPEEGTAIVDALVGLLCHPGCIALLTTHYGNVHGQCRRLRVKGLREEDSLQASSLSPRSIGSLMDYSLVPATPGAASREALRVARLLGVDPLFADEIEKAFKENS